MRPTVAITGATGFIGQHIIRRLRADWRLRILARRPLDPALLGPEVEALQGQLDEPGLQRLLDHVMKHDGVWITRRIDIARHWIATHPYPGKGLNE